MNNPKLYKLVVEAPAASFEREFDSLKTLAQYKRRNPSIIAVPYTLHNGIWERFVTYGNQVIPKTVLFSLLNSLNEGAQPSPTKHLTNNPII